MRYENKISLIILSMAFIVPLIIFNGTLDGFAPKHMLVMSETVQHGHLFSQEAEQIAPGFYITGAIINILTEIPTKEFVFLPIQFVPYLIVFYVFIYKISGSYLLSSSITLIELISSTNGTDKVFFWPHALGWIIFYTMLFIVFKVAERKNEEEWEFRILLILLGMSLAIISYDIFAVSLLFLVIISLLLFLLKLISKIRKENIRRNYLNILIILIVFDFGLLKFVYDVFIPTIMDKQLRDVTAIDKFLLSYVSTESVQTPLSELYISYPGIISIISLIKYSALLISILAFSIITFRKLRTKNPINFYDTIVCSIILVAISYASIRFFLAQFAITQIYLPGIICTIWLYRFSNKLKNWAIFVFLLLMVVVPVYYYENYSNNLIDMDENKYEYIEYPTYWYLENTIQSSISVSDELTKNFFIMHHEKQVEDINYTNIREHMKVLSIDDVAFLLQKSNNSESKYFIVNYDLSRMSLQNWKIIKTWKFSEDKINSNPGIKKIYYSGNIEMYLS
ncbi:MAG: hypothetical protein OIN84_14905 [Candidatus Methanoperedens sp.]|uniref:hypothetical protein n=1 Tax=Candidatus Methanoperedens sp. BLZ2 TaxID=2035255 RepID=UPI001144B911|nr:hypothetical protein [Candidatus Methanoperedens sp. BLZ2]KAB2946784.1 MAG: hypothetical protein F9K14_06420 [Candidatus Methanoperedens sp.]MBZ0175794.1 hypothetical protein [Candidatus Methanoperedens nitroreducens]MCX9079252.1 hypothetical protein [Candidatus Methanoperedens sp.]